MKLINAHRMSIVWKFCKKINYISKKSWRTQLLYDLIMQLVMMGLYRSEKYKSSWCKKC
jgi:hypothetical protein